MRMSGLCLVTALAASGSALGVLAAPSAAADCNYSGGTTICASGTVRGSSGAPTDIPAYDPYPCLGDPTCDFYDNYDPGIIIDPPRPIRPGRPGGGIGIGPR
jgi:hypothetical protein